MNQRATEATLCYIRVLSIRMSVVQKCGWMDGWKWKASSKAISKKNTLISIKNLSSQFISVFSEYETNIL